jgi:transketolase
MNAVTMTDCRKPFAETLIELAHADPRIVAVCNDSVGSSNLGEFQNLFPDRLVNVGIAEQNMVGVGAGLANAGLIPFVCGASPFITGRALEQVKVDVAYNNSHVVLCGMSPGFAYGELGATHHSIEDLAWLRAIDGLDVVVPADARQTAAAVRWAAANSGPAFLRISRTPVPELQEREDKEFKPGASETLLIGLDATIIATGTMVWRAVEAARQLGDEGISVGVINMASIAPMDEVALVRAARATPLLVTVEESVPRGGLGGAVAEIVAHHAPVEMRMLGTDTFAPTGSVEELTRHFGLDAESIAATIRAARVR